MKMETQQIMELLLARMNTSMKKHMPEIKAEMKADRKSDREQMLAEISTRMDANTKEMNAKMDANQVEMRSTVCGIQFELKETIHHEIRAVIQPIRSELDETTGCNEATETEPDPGMMQSIAEHQENPKGEAAVMPVEEPRNRRRVQNLAAECRQKRKERTRGNHGSRRKLAAACRKVSRHAKVAW
jgi:hypothetical protein